MRIGSVSLSLLLATVLSLLGNGFLATLAAVRLADAQVNGTISGAVLAGYFAGLTVGTLLLPPTVSRVGNIRAFSACTALGVAAALAHGFVPIGLGWAPLRFVTGLSMAGVYITIESWLNADAQPAQRGRVMAAYLVSLYLGTALGQVLLPFWPAQGIDAFAFAALMVSLAAIPISLTRTSQPVFDGSTRLTASHLVRVAPLGWWAAAISGFVSATIYANVPLVSRTEGMASGDVSQLMMAFVLGGLAGQWPAGWLSDRIDRRTVMLLVAGSLATCSAIFFVVDELGSGQRLLLAFFFGALAFSLYPLGVAHTIDRIGEGQSLPAATQMLLASSVGAVIGPIAASAASAMFGPKAFFALDGLLLVGLGVGIAARLVRVAPVPQEDFVPLPRTTFAINDLDPRNHPDSEPTSTLGSASGPPAAQDSGGPLARGSR